MIQVELVYYRDCPNVREARESFLRAFAQLKLGNQIACSSCAISVLDMRKRQVAKRAKLFDIHRISVVVIDGKFADCCSVSAPDEQSLRADGIGKSISN